MLQETLQGDRGGRQGRLWPRVLRPKDGALIDERRLTRPHSGRVQLPSGHQEDGPLGKAG